MYILSAVLIVFAFVLLLPIRLGVKFYDKFDIYIKIGLISKRIETDADKKDKPDKKPLAEAEENPKPLKKILYYKDLCLYIKDDVLKIAKYLFRKGVQIEKLNFKMNFGWDDAAAVGMLYGIVNAAGYSIMGFIHNNLIVKKWIFDVNPDYENEVFGIELDCILKTRLVHISIIGIKFLKVLLKVKNKYYRRKKI